jgi:hypothetical protein
VVFVDDKNDEKKKETASGAAGRCRFVALNFISTKLYDIDMILNIETRSMAAAAL